MKIDEVEIIGLFGRELPIRMRFNDDLNILTGKNGAGKTSILKLIWYILSGNINVALSEINFKSIRIKTTEYQCTLYKVNQSSCKIELDIGDVTTSYEDIVDDDGDVIITAESMAVSSIVEHGSSVFFPTFRRIEGGFTLSTSRGFLSPRSRARNEVEEALVVLSRRLTHEPHTFISAISTVDIVGLLLRQYADLSDASNQLQEDTSQKIIERIKSFKHGSTDVEQHDVETIDKANNVIDEIRSEIEDMESKRAVIMAPFEAVRALVEKLFRHSGITMGSRINFGDAAGAINSESLSAGEKQMLSFICYNAFNNNSVVFIDEPELSLHVDWQRQLFAILQSQQSSNQFVIATHSPFIYSKYPDKEICIDVDRGDMGIQS